MDQIKDRELQEKIVKSIRKDLVDLGLKEPSLNAPFKSASIEMDESESSDMEDNFGVGLLNRPPERFPFGNGIRVQEGLPLPRLNERQRHVELNRPVAPLRPMERRIYVQLADERPMVAPPRVDRVVQPQRRIEQDIPRAIVNGDPQFIERQIQEMNFYERQLEIRRIQQRQNHLDALNANRNQRGLFDARPVQGQPGRNIARAPIPLRPGPRRREEKNCHIL